MADGALSWLTMVAARYLADGAGAAPRRAGSLGGALLCYRPYRCADGWITDRRAGAQFWAEFCRGVGREDLVEQQFDPPGSAAHREIEAIVAARTRAEWEAIAAEHDCRVEPVLDLDEVLVSEQVRARDMVVEIEQPGVAAPVRQLGVPVRLSRTPGDPGRRPRPRARGAHRGGAARAGLRRGGRSARSPRPGRWRARPARRRARSGPDAVPAAQGLARAPARSASRAAASSSTRSSGAAACAQRPRPSSRAPRARRRGRRGPRPRPPRSGP